MRAIQTIVDDCLARPILVGRPAVVEMRLEKAGLRIRPDKDFELVNPESDPRFKEYWQTFHQITKRRGVTPDSARRLFVPVIPSLPRSCFIATKRTRLICGVVGQYHKKLKYVTEVLGLQPGCKTLGALSAMATENETLFVCDTHVNANPTAEQLAELTIMAAEKVRLFGMTPKVALVSHSNFGSHVNPQGFQDAPGSESVARAQRRSWKLKARCAPMRRCCR